MVTDKSHKLVEQVSLSCPWLKRVGFWGFMFFLIKGLMWLIVPALLVYFELSN